MWWQSHAEKLNLQGGRYTKFPKFQGFPGCFAAFSAVQVLRQALLRGRKIHRHLWLCESLDPELSPGTAQIITSRHICGQEAPGLANHSLLRTKHSPFRHKLPKMRQGQCHPCGAQPKSEFGLPKAQQILASPGAGFGCTETPQRAGKAEPLRAHRSPPKGEIQILSLPWGLSLAPGGRWSRGITSKGFAELSLAAWARSKGRWRWASVAPVPPSCTPSFVLFYSTKRQNKQASHGFTRPYLPTRKAPENHKVSFLFTSFIFAYFLRWKVTQPWLGINPGRNKNPSWIPLHYKWIVNVLNKSVKMEIQK